ncbi:MAG: hypothetical protein JSS02_11705 [Planctomycetes bacterium]|nr:hypothetical protein [Planctomycetota bacterium]
MLHTHRMFTCKALLVLVLGLILATPARAQFGPLEVKTGLGQGGKKAAKSNGATWSATLSRADSAGKVTLKLAVKLAPEHYVSSTTMADGQLMKFEIESEVGLRAAAHEFVANREPERELDPDDGTAIEKYHDEVSWTKTYQLEAGADPAQVAVKGQVVYQICNASNCLPRQKFPFTAILAAGEPGSAGAGTRTATVDPDKVFKQTDGLKGRGNLVSSWSVSISPRQATPGSEVTVRVQTELAAPWHVFALDQQADADGGGPAPTGIGLTELGGLIPMDARFQGPVPVEHASDAWEGLTERTHEGTVVWTRRYKVPEAATGKLSLQGRVAWQTCKPGTCLRVIGFEFQHELPVGKSEVAGETWLALTALNGAEASEVTDTFRQTVQAATRTDNGPPANPARETTKPAPKGPGAEGAASGFDVGYSDSPLKSENYKSQGLGAFLLLAVLAGFGSLVTPCVFPMIPITVTFFQKQAEKQHHRPITMALVYCLGIIATFTGLGMLMSIAFGAGALNQLSNGVIMNLALAGMLIFFAFNLLGLFEIRMPSWLLTFTAGKESKGGFIGVLFMALTFTLTSFTCTFAFAGLLLAEAMKGDRLWPILGLLAFSAAFSLPFFFLALFPSFLQKLPKSGGWMNIAKVVMGMIEMGFAFKYLGVADQSFNGQAAFIDFHVMLSAWVVLSIAICGYLLGLYRLPHDTQSDHIGVLRFVSALGFLGLAAYLMVGLYSAEKPAGLLWKYAESFANPKFEAGTDPTGPFLKHNELKYALDFEKALKFAIAENKPIFLDFTGVNCANCRLMEKGPMSQPRIKEQLSQFVRIQLFTDSVPINDRTEAARLRDLNVKIQEDWFGDVALPAYVVIPADPAVLEDPGKILAKLSGLNSEEVFSQFLDRGLKGWQKVQAQKNGRVVGAR